MSIHWFFSACASVVTFSILLALVRWIGETQISQATYFNWIAGACMGNIAANMLSANNINTMVNSALQLFFFAIVTIIASWLAIKSRKFREITSGKPLVLIHNGKTIYQHMKRSKIDNDLLKQMLREQGYFDTQNIKYAILEPTGSLSILTEEHHRNSSSTPDVSQTKNPSKEKREENQNTK